MATELLNEEWVDDDYTSRGWDNNGMATQSGYYKTTDATYGRVMYNQWSGAGADGGQMPDAVSFGVTFGLTPTQMNQGITLFTRVKYENFIRNGTFNNSSHTCVRGNFAQNTMGNVTGQWIMDVQPEGWTRCIEYISGGYRYRPADYSIEGANSSIWTTFVPNPPDNVYAPFAPDRSMSLSCPGHGFWETNGNDQNDAYLEDDVWYEYAIFVDPTGSQEIHVQHRVAGTSTWIEDFHYTGQSFIPGSIGSEGMVGIGTYLQPAVSSPSNTARIYYSQFMVWAGNAIADGDIPGSEPDTTPPNISNVTTITGPDSVTINFSTNERAAVQCRYGTTNPPTQLTDITAVQNSPHDIEINNLDLATLYYFQVQATDAANNTSAWTAVDTFTTGIQQVFSETFVDHTQLVTNGWYGGYQDPAWSTVSDGRGGTCSRQTLGNGDYASEWTRNNLPSIVEELTVSWEWRMDQNFMTHMMGPGAVHNGRTYLDSGNPSHFVGIFSDQDPSSPPTSPSTIQTYLSQFFGLRKMSGTNQFRFHWRMYDSLMMNAGTFPGHPYPGPSDNPAVFGNHLGPQGSPAASVTEDRAVTCANEVNTTIYDVEGATGITNIDDMGVGSYSRADKESSATFTLTPGTWYRTVVYVKLNTITANVGNYDGEVHYTIENAATGVDISSEQWTGLIFRAGLSPVTGFNRLMVYSGYMPSPATDSVSTTHDFANLAVYNGDVSSSDSVTFLADVGNIQVTAANGTLNEEIFTAAVGNIEVTAADGTVSSIPDTFVADLGNIQVTAANGTISADTYTAAVGNIEVTAANGTLQAISFIADLGNIEVTAANGSYTQKYPVDVGNISVTAADGSVTGTGTVGGNPVTLEHDGDPGDLANFVDGNNLTNGDTMSSGDVEVQSTDASEWVYENDNLPTTPFTNDTISGALYHNEADGDFATVWFLGNDTSGTNPLDTDGEQWIRIFHKPGTITAAQTYGHIFLEIDWQNAANTATVYLKLDFNTSGNPKEIRVNELSTNAGSSYYWGRGHANAVSSTIADWQFNENAWNCIDIYVKYHASTGEVRVALNEVQLINATGLDTTYGTKRAAGWNSDDVLEIRCSYNCMGHREDWCGYKMANTAPSATDDQGDTIIGYDGDNSPGVTTEVFQALPGNIEVTAADGTVENVYVPKYRTRGA